VKTAPYLTPPKYAAQLGVKPQSIVNWIRCGWLKAINVAKPGCVRPRYRISPEAIREFEESRKVLPPVKRVRHRPRLPEYLRFYA
jgi:hypothetical protein